MTPIRNAYQKWIETFPGTERACCRKPHHLILRQKGNRVDLVHLRDDFVCRREQAWREYVRLRDNNPRFPVNFSIEEED